MKFTKTAIADLKLPDGKDEQFFWDDDLPGFGVRLRGKKATWTVGYRINGRQRREALGDIRKVTLESARKIAQNRFAQVELGVDPAAEKEKKRDDGLAAKRTFEVVAKQYLAVKKGTVRDSTFRHYSRDLLLHFTPFAKRRIDEIKRADVATRLHEIVAESSKRGKARNIKNGLGGRTAASAARAVLSSLFTWAMGEGIVENNPVIATNDPAQGIKSRDRILTDDELAMAWRACEANDYGRIVKLLILTGCRRAEIGNLKWREIDMIAGTITIPGDRTKNHHPLTLGLPPMAIDILKEVTIRNDREFLFGETASVGFNNWSYAAAKMQARIAHNNEGKMVHWIRHDLRRTMRTGLGKLGVAPHIAERVVNHIKGGIEGIYDRYKYEDEIKTALAIWADHVASIIEGKTSNVAVFKRGVA